MELPKEIKDAVEAIEALKESVYKDYEKEYNYIIENNVTDEKRLDDLLDKLLDYYEDKRFEDMFWNLLNYVETFDEGLGAMYRRVEKILTQGY